MTPAVPGTGSSRSSAEQRRVRRRGTARAAGRGRRPRAASASPAAIAAPSSAACARAGGRLGVRRAVAGRRAARRLGVHARVGHDDDRRRAAGRSRAARVRGPVAVAPDQADAADDARPRGCRRGPRAAGRARAARRARASRPATASAGDEAGARSSPRDEPSPRSSGMRFDEAEAVALDRRDERERAQREVLGASRGSSSAPSPSTATSGSPLGRRRRRARSRGRAPPPAQSKPGPRFAVVAGARDDERPSRATSGEDRLDARRRTTVVGSASTSTAAVSFRPWPVRTQTTVLPGSSSTCASAGEAGRRRRLAEDAFAARELEPGVGDLLVGDGDDLDAAARDQRRRPRRGAPARRCGSRRRAWSRARPPAPRRAAVGAPVLREALRVRDVLPPPPYGSASTSGARPSSSTISNAAVFWPSIRCGLSELTSVSAPRSASSRQLAQRVVEAAAAPRAPARRPRATAPASPRRSRPAGCSTTAVDARRARA